MAQLHDGQLCIGDEGFGTGATSTKPKSVEAQLRLGERVECRHIEAATAGVGVKRPSRLLRKQHT